MDYLSVGFASETIETMIKAMRDISINYIEGILYSPEVGVICLGRLSSECPPGYRLQKLTRPQDP